MAYCLNKNLAETFLKKIKDGEIDPQKLSEMSSQERNDFFSTFMGEKHAEKTNALFESKLLLKNQQEGLVNWAKQITGLKPEAKRDLLSRIEKMDKLLTPENEKSFLNDLASQRLGISVTMDEAATIADLAKNVATSKAAIQKGGDRLEYGRALVEFGDYVSNLKNEAKKLTVEDLKAKPLETAVQASKKAVVATAGFAKSIKATFDNSVIGRQGLKTIFSKPDIWLKNSAQSFVDIVKVFGGKDVLQEVKAEVLSRPNAINGLYQKEKLAIGNIEEAFPTSAPEKIPVLGRLFKASEEAFTAWQYRTRADVFDRYVDIAEKSGADITGIGKIVNSLTGRGNIGSLESHAQTLNNVFFSPRYLKSNIDLLTVHAFDKNIGSFARKQAAYNLLTVISGVAAILGIAQAVSPESVEWDTRSADSGQIKVGKTRFNVTGGFNSIITLASRLLTAQTKTKGKVKDLNTGKFGAPTGMDQIYNFFENKLSPVASMVRDIQRGKDFNGNKPTVAGELENLFMPLPVTNYEELKNNPDSADILSAMIADELGIGTNTY